MEEQRMINGFAPPRVAEDCPALVVEPSMESISRVAAFLETELEKLEVPIKIATKLMIALDEVYSNIVHYSGSTRTELYCCGGAGTLNLIFRDDGIPYNPLEAETPDITLSAEERSIGGLGIFMVRKMMDRVDYVYENAHNILTLSMQY
ncbi:MAG: ATP-binding protein [Bacillota bacterium]|nr:ATP-binding protein [Bacillota bacterium]